MNNNKFAIIVLDPWLYEGADGRNMIYGEVVYEKSPDVVIFQSFNEQVFDNAKGFLFVCSARYKDDVLVNVLPDGKKEYKGVFGAGLLKNDVDYKNIESNVLRKESKYVLIGSFKYVNNWEV